MPRTIAGHAPTNPLGADVWGVIQNETDFIASQAFTVVDVDPSARSGSLWLRNVRMAMGHTAQSLRLAAGAAYPVISSGDPTTVAYTCDQFGGKDEVPWELMERSQYPGDLLDEATENVALALLHQLEFDAATLAFTGGNWANTSTLVLLAGGSGVQFGAAGADEVGDLRIARRLCRNAGNGVYPNALIIGSEAAERLGVAVSLRDFMVSTMPGGTGRSALNRSEVIAALASALEMPAENIHVGESRRETAKAGGASVQADTWTDNCLFYYKDDRTSPVAGGATMRGSSLAFVREALGGTPDIKAEVDEDREHRLSITRARWAYATVITNNTWGYLVTNCVA